MKASHISAKSAALIVVLIVAGLQATSAISQDQSARPALVATVTPMDSANSWSYPATVLPAREVELSFRVGGRVVELPIREADEVVEGALIARLDTRDFENAVEQLDSQLQQAQADFRALVAGARAEEIAALEAAVAAAQANEDASRAQVERTQQLFDRGVSTRARLDADQAAWRVAAAQLEAAEQNLQRGLAGGRTEEIESAQAAIRGLEARVADARNDLSDATLLAPFDGVIARREIDNFANILPGTVVVLMHELDTVDLTFDVPGPDVGGLGAAYEAGGDIVAVIDALGDAEFPASFVEFSTAPDPGTLTFRGRVAISVPDASLILPGMVGRVTLRSQNETQSLVGVPLAAIGSDPDGTPFVWIVGDGGVVARRPVSLGEARDETFVIIDGLAAGEIVVAAGVSRLSDGMTVRPITRVGD